MTTAGSFDEVIEALDRAATVVSGDRPVSLAVLGPEREQESPDRLRVPVVHREARPDSDLDILLIARKLPQGRMRCAAELGAVEDAMSGTLERALAQS